MIHEGRVLLTILAASACLGALAVGQEEADGDGAPAWTFGAMDADGNGTLGRNELGSGIFSMFAAEGEDLSLGMDRFELVLRLVPESQQTYEFETADLNGDGVITLEREFLPTVGADLLGAWDADGDEGLTEEEYRQGWLTALDTDEDGTVSEQEIASYQEVLGEDVLAVAGYLTNGE